MKKLTIALCILSLVLSFLTFKKEYYDHPRDIKSKISIAYQIGCFEWSYGIYTRFFDSTHELALYCKDKRIFLTKEKLLDSIEKVESNIGPVYE